MQGYTTSSSRVTRPYVISLDGDLPPGATATVIVRAQIGALDTYRTFVNPIRQAFLGTLRGFTLQLAPAPGGLATPIIYGVTVEGDRKKQTFDAERLAAACDLARNRWVLARDERGRQFLTCELIPKATVRASEVTRPWIVTIDGWRPTDTQLLTYLTGEFPGGADWNHTLEGPCREEIPVVHKLAFRYELKPSSDFHQSPALYSVTIEGDNRSYYRDAAALVGEEVPEHLLLLPLDEGRSCLTLKPKFPKFLGPPSALSRLTQMSREGKLDPVDDENL